jgi:glycosyltransferase involved in cell wall biosynthesis
MADTKLDYEVIVVDDGSEDETYNIASDFARKDPKVKVTRNSPNMGKGHAIKRGFQHSTGAIVAYMDADLSMHPQQLTHYLRKLGGADAVIASKRHPKSDISYPLHRKILSKGFNLLVRAMFGLNLSDTQCGFKVFRRRVLEDVMPRLLVKRYAFDVELLVNAYRRGYRVVEAPITLRHGEERLRLRDVFRMAADLLAIFYRLHFTKTYEG